MAGNELKEDDLVDILEDLWDARESARFIGLQLKIKDSTLETIVQSTTDKGEILRQILKEYLKGNGWRPVTRERLIKALETKMVGQRRLAEELRQKYSPASSGSDESTDHTSENHGPATNQEPLTTPQTALSQEASGSSASDSGVYNSGSENTSDSSGKALAPETPLMKSQDVSNSEHTANGRDEQQEYKAMSNDAIREVLVVFAKLYEGVRSTCKSGVSYQEVKKIILPVADNPSQLKTGVATAQSSESVWSYLDKYSGWVNSRPIEMLAIKKGNDSDKENNDEFIRKRNWLLVLLKKNYNERTKELILKLDVDYDEFKDENLEVVQFHLCSLLACHVTVLKVERGCVKITVAIPAETAEDIFPLSPTMREEFRQAFPSIMFVKCGKNEVLFENTHNSEEEKNGTESQDEEREEGESEENRDEEGYTADESGSDWSTEEEQQESTEPGQSEESLDPQMAETKTRDITREQEADVEQEGGRMRREESKSCKKESREEDRELGTHVSESRESGKDTVLLGCCQQRSVHLRQRYELPQQQPELPQQLLPKDHTEIMTIVMGRPFLDGGWFEEKEVDFGEVFCCYSPFCFHFPDYSPFPNHVKDEKALHRAAMSEDVSAVRRLIAANINMDCTLFKDGWTPLMTASFRGHVEVVRALIGSQAQLNTQDKRGWTALHLAAKEGKVDVVRLLTEAGAQLNIQDKWFSSMPQPAHKMVDPDLQPHIHSDLRSSHLRGAVPSKYVQPPQTPKHAAGKLPPKQINENHRRRSEISLQLYDFAGQPESIEQDSGINRSQSSDRYLSQPGASSFEGPGDEDRHHQHHDHRYDEQGYYDQRPEYPYDSHHYAPSQASSDRTHSTKHSKGSSRSGKSSRSGRSDRLDVEQEHSRRHSASLHLPRQRGDFDPSGRRQQMRISLTSHHPPYHMTSCSHICQSEGKQRFLQHRRSRSVDLTPVVELPESCTTTPGVAIPDRAKGLFCGHMFSPAMTPTGEPFRVLSPISLSADNLPALCLNDRPMAVTPMTQLGNRALGTSAARSPLSSTHRQWSVGPAIKPLPALTEKASPTSSDKGPSDRYTSQDSSSSLQTTSTQSSGPSGQSGKSEEEASVFSESSVSGSFYTQSSTSTSAADTEESVKRRQYFVQRGKQNELTHEPDSILPNESDYGTSVNTEDSESTSAIASHASVCSHISQASDGSVTTHTL